MDFRQLLESSGESWLGTQISNSNWLFPAIEGVHIVALAVLCGAIFVLNLRLCGLTLRNTPAEKLARELAPWTFVSLVLMLITGAMLFTSAPAKYYESSPFRIKMVLLSAAILFHYTIYWRLTAGGRRAGRLWSALAASVSIVLWFGVGFAGRAIGFF